MTQYKKLLSVRKAALQALLSIVEQGHSSSRAIPTYIEQVEQKDRGLLQELVYGVLRWYDRLALVEKSLLQKPLRAKDRDIELLILLGLYQLSFLAIPPHAAVQETVKIAAIGRKKWARGLVNAVLRRYLREKDKFLQRLANDPGYQYSHPQWMLAIFKDDWPDYWKTFTEQANLKAPMVLRVNQRQYSRESYLRLLQESDVCAEFHPYAAHALVLDRPVNVQSLPFFADGAASVQDAGAQLAGQLLAPASGERILDACAAPGGKACHLLEMEGDIHLTALDNDADRCAKVFENLERLNLNAVVKCADAAEPDTWWDGKQFDAILLDAPCSALGVIRRHPDIKLLRKPEDIAGLVQQQRRLLATLWPLLKPGGRLLYSTCSLARDENVERVTAFLASHDDAVSLEIQADWGVSDTHGRQILTGQDAMDGFYYALFEKKG